MDHLILKQKIQFTQIISNCHLDNIPLMFIKMYDENKIYRTLFKIPMNKLPQDIEIVEAKLKLVLMVNETNSTNVVTPYAIAENWDMNTVTWHNQPSYNSVIFGQSVNVKCDAKYIFDITNIVKKWYGNEIPNNGIILKNHEKHCSDFAKVPSDKKEACGPTVEIIYKANCPCIPTCNKFIDKSEEFCTNDSYHFSQTRNTSLTSTVMFFVKNLEIDEIKAHIQVSPDGVNFINEPMEILVEMDTIKFIVPCIFAKFTRVAVKNIHCGKTSRVKIWYQAQW